MDSFNTERFHIATDNSLLRGPLHLERKCSACVLQTSNALQASQADLHRQVHVHAGMPCKFNHYVHACFARNYPEVLSHCGHGHDLTSVAQLSVINIAYIRSAFDKTLESECCHSKPAVTFIKVLQYTQALLLLFNLKYNQLNP